jgi:sortase A
VFGKIALVLAFVAVPLASAEAQSSVVRRLTSCQCEPGGKPRKPRFLLPVAGGLGFLPIAIAARDSQLPMLALPSLVDIRDDTPRNALEGERQLAVGALAPDTATPLPTFMVLASVLLLTGVYLVLPRARRRRAPAWRTDGSGRRGGWKLRSLHRRRIGGALAAGGGVLLLLGSREYAEGAEAQRAARAEWLQAGQTMIRIDDATESLPAAAMANPGTSRSLQLSVATLPASPGGVESVVPLPLFAMSGRELRRGSAVARLLIPAIELDEIVMEGVGPVELNGGPGHFPGSVLPGDTGNSIISAHRDRHFRRMGEIVVGSRIRTETRAGATDWVVAERRVVSRDTPALFEESEATLTLTTCWPLRYFGPAPDRLLIVAKRVTD